MSFKLLFLSVIYVVLLNYNYFLIKTSDYSLYLGDWFHYDPILISFLLSNFLGIVVIYTYLLRVGNSIFTGLLSALVLLGVAPAIVIYASSRDPSGFYFYICYIIPFLSLMYMSRPSISVFRSSRAPIYNQFVLRVWALKVLIFISWILLIYFFATNYTLLTWSGLDDVYSQRFLTQGSLNNIERYLYLYMKYVGGGFSILLMLYLRSYIYYVSFLFIYVFDYLYGAHKFSIGIILFISGYLIYLKFFARFMGGAKLFFFNAVLLVTLLFSVVISIFRNNSSFTPYLISMYDRLYFVSAGIFARNYDFVSENYYFYGGSSSLGRVLGSKQEDVYYVIGEKYWSEGVVANTDIVSDAFVNFGSIGAIITVFILWSFFNKNNDIVYSDSLNCIYPLTVLYSMSAIFSLGLSIALLSGGLIFYILLIKYIFRSKT